MTSQQTSDMPTRNAQPFTVRVAAWYGYILAATFILKGGVDIILGVLDNKYEDFAANLIYVLMGVIVASVAAAFRDRKAWAWIAMLTLNGLALLGSGIQVADYYYLVLAVASLGALIALLSPQTRAFVHGNTR